MLNSAAAAAAAAAVALLTQLGPADRTTDVSRPACSHVGTLQLALQVEGTCDMLTLAAAAVAADNTIHLMPAGYISYCACCVLQVPQVSSHQEVVVIPSYWYLSLNSDITQHMDLQQAGLLMYR
jgi:hypothetical protein